MDIARSNSTLHWLVVGGGQPWAAFLDSVSDAHTCVQVDDWAGAVRHLVAFHTVRAVVYCRGSVPDLERAVRQAYAMKPGITVFLASDIDPLVAPSIRRLSPGDVPPEVWP